MTTTKRTPTTTVRHNHYAVDITGPADNVDRAMQILNAHNDLVRELTNTLDDLQFHFNMLRSTNGSVEGIHERVRAANAAIQKATGPIA